MATKSRRKRLQRYSCLDGLSNFAWQRIRTDHPYSLTKLARAVGVSISRLWHHAHGHVRWPADLWLACMVSTGQTVIVQDELIVHMAIDARGKALVRTLKEKEVV